MRASGLIFNTKRVFIYFLLLVLGLSLMVFGVISYYYETKSYENSITDEEIISRAKALGMVEVKELINTEEEENHD